MKKRKSIALGHPPVIAVQITWGTEDAARYLTIRNARIPALIAIVAGS